MESSYHEKLQNHYGIDLNNLDDVFVKDTRADTVFSISDSHGESVTLTPEQGTAGKQKTVKDLYNLLQSGQYRRMERDFRPWTPQ